MSPNKAINMDKILQPLDPCLDLVSPAPLPVLDHVNWSELLENYPSGKLHATASYFLRIFVFRWKEI